jgi:hypothetical protein
MGGGSLTDLITATKNISVQLGNLYQLVASLFPRVIGTFTFGASATVSVSETNVTSATRGVVIIPTNASAGTLIGSTKSPYVSTLTPGSGFVVSTASGAAAAGTETFLYYLVN